MALILVADDEVLVRTTFRNILQRAGHEVVEARDGDEVLAAHHSQRPDLVLIDIIMPNREGVETIAALRRIDPDLPIVAMSGGGRMGSRIFLDFAGKLGANRMLSKPVRNEALLSAIAECLAASLEPAGAAPRPGADGYCGWNSL